MSRLDASGTDEMMELLRGLGSETERVCSMALYKGAQITADALREATESLPTEPWHPVPGMRGGRPLEVITEADKEDLLNGIGIAKFEHTGSGVSTAASFEGYTRRTERNFPNGVPLPMIARSIESGSSVRRKNPFIRRTVTAREPEIIDAMEETVHNAVDVYVATGSLPAFDAGGGSGGKGTHKQRT